MNAIEKLLTVTEAAKRIGVSRFTIYRYIESGEIRAYQKEGKRGLKIPESELQKYELKEYIPKKEETLNKCLPPRSALNQGHAEGKLLLCKSITQGPSFSVS